MKTRERLRDLYRFPGFTPEGPLSGIFGDSHARVVHLARRGKKQSAGPAGRSSAATTTATPGWCGISPAAGPGSTSASTVAASPVGAAAR